MNQRTRRGIESARRASYESAFPRYHLGAALYYNGVLLATGCNSTKTSPLQKRLNAERDFNPDQSGVENMQMAIKQWRDHVPLVCDISKSLVLRIYAIVRPMELLKKGLIDNATD